MDVADENRMWLAEGNLRAILSVGGFVPLELVADGVVIARPVPRPVDGRPDRVEIDMPLPREVLSDGIHVLVLRRQGEVEAVATLPFIVGAGASETLAVEVALLREEMELLKSVLRERLRRGL